MVPFPKIAYFSQVLIKVMRIFQAPVHLRNFRVCKITSCHLRLGLFFNRAANWGPTSLLKRDSGAGVFLRILSNF